MSYSHYDYHSAMDIESSPYGGVYSAPTFSFVHESPQQDCALIAQVADNYVAPIKRPLKQFTRKRKPASSCGASSPVALAAQLSPSASPVGSPTLAAPTSSSTKKHWHRPEPVSDDSDEARFCKACGITTTPQWRRGPDGERSLCNACGLHFYKILQREKTTERKREVGTKLPIEMLLNDPDY